jgi:hypothetical protein
MLWTIITEVGTTVEDLNYSPFCEDGYGNMMDAAFIAAIAADRLVDVCNSASR